MINEKAVELSLPNVVGYERIAMGCSETFAKNLGFAPERIEDLKTAVAEACLNAMRIHGNYGYRRDHHYERLLRDSIGLFFAGGTSEIHKTVIWANLVAEAQNRSKAKDDLRLDAYTGEGAAA